MILYEKDTGDFTWINGRKGRKGAGYIAGHINDMGYRMICINGKSYRAHRLAWLYVNGTFPTYEIDHINGIRSDNRFINLRSVSSQENHKNRRPQKNNTSGATGVSWFKQTKKWAVRIYVNRRAIHLGYYHEIDDAILAREKAAERYGFHANHGKGKRCDPR